MVNVTIYMAYIRILIGIYSKYDEQMPPKNVPFNNSNKSALCLIFAMPPISYKMLQDDLEIPNFPSPKSSINSTPQKPPSEATVMTLRLRLPVSRSNHSNPMRQWPGKIMRNEDHVGWLPFRSVKQPHIGTSQLQMCHISSAGLSCQPCGGSTNHEVDEVIHVSQLGWYLANF